MPVFFKDQEQVSYVAYNLGTLCVTIFWLQGLAVVWWLPHRYPMMKPLRLFIMILSAFIGFVQMFVVFLGIADMAVDYRKREITCNRCLLFPLICIHSLFRLGLRVTGRGVPAARRNYLETGFLEIEVYRG